MAEKRQEIITRDEAPPLAEPQGPSVGSVLQLIERAATDERVDVEKMERLLAMQERILAIQAKRDAMQAKQVMMAEMPRVSRHGEIIIAERGTRRVIQRTRYAKWEDIDAAIRPILSKHGFVLSFRSSEGSDGKILMTAVLTHQGPAGTYEETSTLPIPPDPSGSKNAIQALGSSLSYGKRYTATPLLNLVFEGEDDDGNGGRHQAPETINDLQVLDIENALKKADADPALFLRAFEIEKVEDLPRERFEEAMQRITGRRRR
ncbi:MAG TPA: ERF family protein [Beijerinckiaceae bacterium]|nr:ERF family protein [Beijerinckiaceae bacterium]